MHYKDIRVHLSQASSTATNLAVLDVESSPEKTKAEPTASSTQKEPMERDQLELEMAAQQDTPVEADKERCVVEKDLVEEDWLEKCYEQEALFKK